MGAEGYLVGEVDVVGVGVVVSGEKVVSVRVTVGEEVVVSVVGRVRMDEEELVG